MFQSTEDRPIKQGTQTRGVSLTKQGRLSERLEFVLTQEPDKVHENTTTENRRLEFIIIFLIIHQSM